MNTDGIVKWKNVILLCIVLFSIGTVIVSIPFIRMGNEISRQQEAIEELERIYYLPNEIDGISAMLNNQQEQLLTYKEEHTYLVGSLSELSSKLNMTTSSLSRMIIQNKEYTDEAMRGLSKKLGVTEEELSTVLIGNNGDVDWVELNKLAEKMDMSVSELNMQIAHNLTLTRKDVALISSALGSTQEELEQKIISVQNDLWYVIQNLSDTFHTSVDGIQNSILQNRELTDEDIFLLADRLNTSVEELRSFIESNSDNVNVLTKLSEKFNVSITELNDMIITNANLTEDDIRHLSDTLNISIQEINQTIAVAREDYDKRLEQYKQFSIQYTDELADTTQNQVKDLNNSLSTSVEKIEDRIEQSEGDVLKYADGIAANAKSQVDNLENSLSTSVGELHGKIEENQIAANQYTDDVAEDTKKKLSDSMTSKDAQVRNDLENSILELAKELKNSNELTKEDIATLADLLEQLSLIVEGIEQDAVYFDHYDSTDGTVYLRGGMSE